MIMKLPSNLNVLVTVISMLFKIDSSLEWAFPAASSLKPVAGLLLTGSGASFDTPVSKNSLCTQWRHHKEVYQVYERHKISYSVHHSRTKRLGVPV